jgi:hypothetical protein
MSRLHTIITTIQPPNPAVRRLWCALAGVRLKENRRERATGQGQFMKAIWHTGGSQFGLLAEEWSEFMRYCGIG